VTRSVSTEPVVATPRDQEALALEGITVRFGSVTALEGAHCTIRRGTVHAILGENGAGKSTLMRAAFGWLTPDAGTIRVHGAPVSLQSSADAISRGVGMVHQHFMLVPAMTVTENIALGGQGRFDASTTAARIAEVATKTGLPVDPSARVRDLAVSAQQRVEIVKALVREAQILILDEPTSGLDPNQILEIRDVIRDLGRSKTVVLSTHVLSEVEAMCGRAIVIVGGAVHADVPVGGAQGEAEVVVLDAPDGLGDALARIPGVNTVKAARNGATSTFRLTTGGDARAVLEPVGRLCAEKRCVVTALGTAHTDLEEIFRKLQGARGAAKEAVS